MSSEGHDVDDGLGEGDVGEKKVEDEWTRGEMKRGGQTEGQGGRCLEGFDA